MPKSGAEFVRACFEVGLPWEFKIVLMAIAHITEVHQLQTYSNVSLAELVGLSKEDLNAALQGLLDSGYLVADGERYALRWDAANVEPLRGL